MPASSVAMRSGIGIDSASAGSQLARRAAIPRSFSILLRPHDSIQATFARPEPQEQEPPAAVSVYHDSTAGERESATCETCVDTLRRICASSPGAVIVPALRCDGCRRALQLHPPGRDSISGAAEPPTDTALAQHEPELPAARTVAWVRATGAESACDEPSDPGELPQSHSLTHEPLFCGIGRLERCCAFRARAASSAVSREPSLCGRRTTASFAGGAGPCAPAPASREPSLCGRRTSASFAGGAGLLAAVPASREPSLCGHRTTALLVPASASREPSLCGRRASTSSAGRSPDFTAADAARQPSFSGLLATGSSTVEGRLAAVCGCTPSGRSADASSNASVRGWESAESRPRGLCATSTDGQERTRSHQRVSQQRHGMSTSLPLASSVSSRPHQRAHGSTGAGAAARHCRREADDHCRSTSTGNINGSTRAGAAAQHCLREADDHCRSTSRSPTNGGTTSAVRRELTLEAHALDLPEDVAVLCAQELVSDAVATARRRGPRAGVRACAGHAARGAGRALSWGCGGARLVCGLGRLLRRRAAPNAR